MAVLSGLVLLASTAWAESAPDSWDNRDPIAPLKAPFPMPALARPQFPRRLVDIREHGAVGDGRTTNTRAFADAIAACAKLGGGCVLVPAGRWLTGPIHLKSNIDLHLDEGAEIVFSDCFEDYLPPVLVRVGGIELYNYSPLIYARDCENVAVTGPGRLDGNARAWWSWKSRETRKGFEMGAAGVPVEKRVFGTPEAAIRPSFLSLVDCRNVLLEGFTIGGGPNWTIHPIYCENVIIRRVSVLTDGPNNDGIDPDSCRNVLIEHCLFDTGDDCVVLKSGYNEDGWRVGRPTENVVMRHCLVRRGHGGLVIGSEMSGGVRNVYMHDCEFDGTDRAVRIKSRRDRGGVVENVWAEHFKTRNMQREVVILNMDYSADRNQPVTAPPPVFRNIHIRNVLADGAPAALVITGLPDSPIRDLHVSNMVVSAKRGVVCANAQGLEFSNMVFQTKIGPAFDLADTRDVTIQGVAATLSARPFLKVTGAGSAKIRLRNVAPGDPATAIQTAREVNAVEVNLQ